MEKNQKRAKTNHYILLTSKNWESLLNEGDFVFIKLEQNENELARKLLVFDTNDFEVADLRFTLAKQYHSIGELPKAIEYLEKAMEAYWGHYDYDDPELFHKEMLLAKLYEESQEYTAAIHVLETLLYVHHYNGISQNWMLNDATRLLAQICVEADQAFYAIELFDSLLENESVHSNQNEGVLDLAKAYRKAGMTSESIRLLDQPISSIDFELALALAQKWQLALSYNELGCHEKSLQLANEVLNLELKQKGIDYLDIAYLLDFTGGLLLKLGAWDKGRRRLQEAYCLFRINYGEKDERTKSVKKKLDDIGF